LRSAVLAEQAGMSERTFIRTFREDTGQSPTEFVTSARLQAARRLLEDTDLPLKAVAQRCGFASAAVMRRVFMRELGVSTTDYRERFSGVHTGATAEMDRSPA
jgi:transcriptional regulator GlxA family with amidase domain